MAFLFFKQSSHPHSAVPSRKGCVTAHFVAPMHVLSPGDKMCCIVDTVLGGQNVLSKFTYFVIPQRINNKLVSQLESVFNEVIQKH